MKALIAIASFLGGAVLAVVARAHHSSAPHYDMAKQISVQGVVSKFEFVNPHAYVYFVVAGSGGQQQAWRCELSASATLSRLGWNAGSFGVGQKLTFKGNPARREENVCVLNSFIAENGRELSSRANLLGGVGAQRGPVPVAVVAENTAALNAGQSALDLMLGYWVSPTQAGPGGRGARGSGGAAGQPGARGARGDGAGGRPQASDAGVAAAKDYDQRYDDPAVHCSPANIVFGWTHDQNVNEIVRSGADLTLKYGYMDFVRTIHMNTSAHPASIAPTVGGHSIGKFEGSVLVVDTVGFVPGVLLPLGGIQHSDRMHVVERFELDATGNSLTRRYTVDDSLYLKASYGGSDVVLRSRETPKAYRCTELSGKNNLRQPR